MSFITNVVRREGRYVYRCRIPADLVPLLGRTEYKKALHTSSPSVARRRAAEVSVAVMDVFEGVRAAVTHDGDITEADVEEARRKAEEAKRRFAEFKFTVDTLEHEQQMEERLRAAAERLKAVKGGVERLKGRHAEAREVRRELQGTVQLLVEAVAGRPSAPAPLPSTLSKPFSHFAHVHVEERKAGKGLEPHSESQLRARLDLFARILGDRPITEYARDDITAYLQTLERMPASYGKTPKDATRSITDILARPGERYSRTTSEKHFEAVKAVFETAACHGADVKTNMFNNLVAKGTPPAERKTWSDEQLRALFSTPVWTGRKSKFGEFKDSWVRGTRIQRDCWFWLPMIAIYTGMRVEEIAKLRAKDVRQEQGIWLIDVNEEVRRNKTQGSARRVPLHEQLVRLGFVAFASAKRPDEFLFPELPPDGAGKRGQAYSRDFGRYRQRCGVYERWRDFHSFRHTFASTLYDATKDILCVAAIAGHTAKELKDLAEEKGENAAKLDLLTVDYIHRQLHAMKAAIDKLAYPGLELSGLHSANGK